jgi:hypothetical protein
LTRRFHERLRPNGSTVPGTPVRDTRYRLTTDAKTHWSTAIRV